MVYQYLKENYILGEPIFTGDIDIPGMTEENLRYQLKKLTDDGTTCRFEQGVYYFPKIGIFGDLMPLSSDTVAVHKYIMRKGKRIGYYSGHTLANRIGLSMQVPFIQEIISNYAPASVRKIMIKNKQHIIRRPVIKITEDNAAVLQFLDCLKDLDRCSELEPKESGKILSEFAMDNNITKEMVDMYIDNYPIKIYKAIYETGVKIVSSLEQEKVLSRKLCKLS